MAEPIGDRSDPRRRRLFGTTRTPAPLAEVAEAIALFTEHPGHAYIERHLTGWRWSPAHRGGAYPLLRVCARWLGVDHHRVIVPFRTVGDGWAVLMPDEGVAPNPLAATVLAFEEPATVELIVERLGEAGLRSEEARRSGSASASQQSSRPSRR
jgi:hypothetical protein